MSRPAIRLGCLAMVFLSSGITWADDARPAPEAPDLGATQVTLAIEKGGRHRLFRATVLAIEEDTLTVLTAAKFVDGKVEGHPARLLVAGELIEGTVVSVAVNPAHVPGKPTVLRGVTAGRVPLPRYSGPSTTYYNNTRLRSIAQPLHRINLQQLAATTTSEIPGADNAIARFRFPAPPGSGKAVPAFAKIRPANFSDSGAHPGASGGSVSVRVVACDGHEHTVRACNFHNPFLLEWGHGFDPVTDDAGGGVFALRESPEGRIEAILIGVLFGPDERGGLASLVARRTPWVEQALAPKIAEPAAR